MYHNAVPTAEFRVMTGFEARTLNSKYRQDFIEEVERVYPAYVEVPLKHWTVVERFTEDNPGAAQ